MDILHRDDLTEGDFAGLKEHRLIKDPAVFGQPANRDGSWPGLGRCVYLSNAHFMPHGDTRLHDHFEVDVISVMVEGNITHQGYMGHGQDLHQNDVQIHRASSEGFSHNEMNPDDHENRMIQLWVLPEESDQAASYKVYATKPGEITRIYGGNEYSDFPARTQIDVALLEAGQSLEVSSDFVAYLTRGTGMAKEESTREGDLLRGDELSSKAREAVQLIMIHTDDW